MSSNFLADFLIKFIETSFNKRMCNSHGVFYQDPLGYLYEQMSPKCQKIDQNPQAWLDKSARGHLRNYFNRVVNGLDQTDDPVTKGACRKVM